MLEPDAETIEEPKKQTRKRHEPEVRDAAKRLFLRGFLMDDIAERVNVNINTLYLWRNKYNWDDEHQCNTVEESLAQRLILLNETDDKTPQQEKDFANLIKLFGQFQKDMSVAKKNNAIADAIAKGRFPPVDYLFEEFNAAPKKSKAKYDGDGKKPKQDKKVKNDISEITKEMIDAVLETIFFQYQRLWWDVKNSPLLCRQRFLLKSRQIGATYYMAFEALADAILTGDNQLFLSASRDQAEVFKAYIIAFAQEHFGVELKGQGVILLSNGAELRFLSTNSTTAQSYHGHLYIDEVFWIPNYKKMQKIASGMAAHKKWRKTYFSTPSAISHEAYAIWSGKVYNDKRAENNKVAFDISHDALKNGWQGPDKIWRHMVTIEDAEAQGCDLFDIETLKLEYSDEDFKNLFLCEFIDDAQSAFSLAALLACTVELEQWPDYHETDTRPFGNKEVALGYDPSRTRDNASLAVLAVPTPAKPWRVMKTHTLHGQNFQNQANRIKDTYDTHHVVHIGIDNSGIGQGVFELVESFCHFATPITYSVETKTRLVLKAMDVINNGRFQYLAQWADITRSFLMIKKTTTQNSQQITYSSGRTNNEGHADIAWSIMHALAYEPLDNDQRKSRVYM